jgi:hypothetical protein
MIHLALTIAAFLFLCWIGFIGFGIALGILGSILGPKKPRYIPKGAR